MYFGDFAEDDTVDIPFNTFTSDDPSASSTITNFVNTDVHIHKDGGLTQRNNAAGITVSVNFDGITGNHLVKIDTSDNTVAGFWVTGSEYQVRIEGATVDGATINVWIGAFSIERAGGVIALLKLIQAAVITNAAGTDVAADIIAVKAETATIVNDTDVIDDGTSGLVKIAQDVAAVLVDTAGINGDAMRGTNSANTTVPDAAGTAPTAAEINAEVDTALSDVNLDHFMKTATAGADMTTEIADNTALSRILANGDTSAFTPSTDGLQPIRDRGDAAWAGAPESVSGTIAVDTADTIFDLTATSGTLSTADDTYNNMIVCILDNSGSVYETARITDYDGTGATKITIDHELTFPVQDGVDTFVIYRAAYAPVGAASITESDKNDIVDKVHDEDLLAAHSTPGTAGYHIRRTKGRY